LPPYFHAIKKKGNLEGIQVSVIYFRKDFLETFGLFLKNEEIIPHM
jgi:hypothetical protein